MTHRIAVFFGVFVLFTTSSAAAQDPILCEVPNCITLSPGPRYPGNPIGAYTVHVEDFLGPMVGALVTITFSSGADALISWCKAPYGGLSGQVHPVVSGFTDANGNYTFELWGGGCVTDQPCATPPATVTVSGDFNTFTEDIYCVSSPDAVTAQGKLPKCPSKTTCDNVSGVFMARVTLADVSFHVFNIVTSKVEPCSKFTLPFGTACNLFDAQVLTPYIINGNSCLCQ